MYEKQIKGFNSKGNKGNHERATIITETIIQNDNFVLPGSSVYSGCGYGSHDY